MMVMQAPITVSTADIYDTYHERVLVCDLQFRSFGKLSSFAGPAATLIAFEDHLPVLAALSQPGESRVLVVDAGGSLRIGVMGDRLAAIGARFGWVGVIINGAIRDSAGIDELDIGVKATGTTARRAWIASEGRHAVPVMMGGVVIEPGAWIYADQDAVLVAPEKLDLSVVQPGGKSYG